MVAIIVRHGNPEAMAFTRRDQATHCTELLNGASKEENDAQGAVTACADPKSRQGFRPEMLPLQITGLRQECQKHPCQRIRASAQHSTTVDHRAPPCEDPQTAPHAIRAPRHARSEERRVGKECRL